MADTRTTPRRWRLAHGRSIELGAQAVVMGILNVTPDSFSDGGRFDDLGRAVAQAERMVAEGATIIDVGGESTRPGGTPIDAAQEQARVLPVLEALAARLDVVLSIDTYRSETARLALAAGAHIVNDVWGLSRDPALAALAAETGAGLVIMHTGRERQKHPDVIADQHVFLEPALATARAAGVADAQIALDPGFGFAKDADENLALAARFEELAAFGLPLVAGTSRKRFIGHATGREGGAARAAGTAATSAILRLKGASVFRVHDVAINVDALRMTDAILAARPGGAE